MPPIASATSYPGWVLSRREILNGAWPPLARASRSISTTGRTATCVRGRIACRRRAAPALIRPLRPRAADLVHGLNERLPKMPLRCVMVTTCHDLFVRTGEYLDAQSRARFAAQARDAAERSEIRTIAVSAYTRGQVMGFWEWSRTV